MHRHLFVLIAIAALSATDAFGHGDEPHHPQQSHKRATVKETAFGRAGDPAQAQRTILIEMRDSYEFSPSEITVKVGEIVRFVPVNVGKHMHEMVLGTMKELQDHYELMKTNPAMPHNEAHMAHVEPGKSAVIVWQFTKPGEFYFGCLIEDHLDAGMMGKVRVLAQ
jgi:uncharacterized cupredoxin-like copper-binding protein